MTDQKLQIHIKNRVGFITFNRPDKLNALTEGMLVRGIDQLKKFAVDPDVGAVVVTGKGRAFCAGGDVAVMQSGAEFGPV